MYGVNESPARREAKPHDLNGNGRVVLRKIPPCFCAVFTNADKYVIMGLRV